MVDRITSIVADLAYKVEENTFYEKQSIKKEIRRTKSEIEESYKLQAEKTKGKGWINDVSAFGTLAATCASFFMPSEATAKVVETLASNSFPLITRSLESSADGDITRLSGKTQLGLREQETKNEQLQRAGTTSDKVNQMMSDILKFNEQIAG